jgi:unsaturated pyranuronate lyase
MTPELREYFIDPSKAPSFKPMNGVETSFLTGLQGEKAMMVLTTVYPGYAVPAHAHPHEQMGQVQAGKAIMIIGDHTRTVTKGDFCYFPPNVEHSAECVGEEAFVMLDIFHPIREDFAEAVKNQQK